MKTTFKIINFLLIIIIIFNGFFVFKIEKAQAIFGTIPTIDLSHIATTVAKWMWDMKEKIIDYALEVALETAKKRILDMLVDDIIQWIQEGDLTGGGQGQKFVVDWKRYINTAAQEAVGDLAQELGMGFLCGPINGSLQFQIMISSIYGRSFSERAACTLNQIVDNVEDFMRNFNVGGWLAYTEMLNPQNNALGLAIMTYDEAIIRASNAKIAAIQEAQASQGFLGAKECLEYTDKYGKKWSKGTPNFEQIQNWIKEGNEIVQELKIRCTESEIVTPGKTVGAALEKAIGSDFDYIINARDLSQYAAAIVDALINRVVKEGVKLVKKSTESEQTSRFTGVVNDYTQTIQQRDQQRREVLLTRVNENIKILNEASINLTNASATNNLLIDVLQQLIACQNQKNIVIDPNASSTLEYASSTRKTIIKQEMIRVNNFLTQANRIKDDLNNPSVPLNNNLLKEIEEVENNAQPLKLNSIDLLSEIKNVLNKARENLNSCLLE